MGIWQLSPAPLAAGAVALVLYGRGFARLRRRRASLAGWGAAALFTGGVLVAVLALVSPLDELGEQKLLTAHMGQHLLLGDIAPLLIVLGLRGPMTFFVLPPELLGALARMRPLRKALSFLLTPKVSLAVWAAVIYVWHIPTLYDAAIAHQPLHDFEHATFLLVGLLVWIQIVDPARHHRLSSGARAGFAGLVLLAGLPLCEILIAFGPLYPHYRAIVHRPLGFSAGSDQTHAGLLMMAEQIGTLVTAASILLWNHMEEVADREAGLTGPAQTGSPG